jgi:glyoxylase-like metal-dependent hydrolase (beta-lactamase superfamily II)
MSENISRIPAIHTSFEPVTGTWQYIVSDPSTRDAAIIDSVLDFDPAASRISTKSADELLSVVTQEKLQVKYIMETHAHADHLTAARYLQQKLLQLGQPRPEIAIGKRIVLLQETFASEYAVPKEELESVFDKLWEDDESFQIGNLKGEVLHLPGHTPDHVGYKIEGSVFTGDSIFNPDVGSARADFPGGSATDLWSSAQKLLALPENFRLYTGHDYPPATRESNESGEKWKAYTTVKEQRTENKHVKAGTKEEEFVAWRRERDAGLGEPRLLHQALQFNVRGGRLPRDGFLRVPVKGPDGTW